MWFNSKNLNLLLVDNQIQSIGGIYFIIIFMSVVYFDQLLGAALTQKLVELQKTTEKRQFRGNPSVSRSACQLIFGVDKHTFFGLFIRFLLISGVKSLKKV